MAKGKLTADEQAEVQGRVSATDQLDGLVECDLVIESVVEDLTVKKALFAELDRVAQPDAIFASNTSTLPIVELAVQTQRPDRVRPALLQPGTCHEAGGDRATDHRQRPDRRVRPRLRHRLPEGAGRGGRPPGSW